MRALTRQAKLGYFQVVGETKQEMGGLRDRGPGGKG